MPADTPTPTPERRPTASERFLAAIGKPVPPPLTDEQARAFEAAQDRADADLARLYGGSAGQAAAA